MQESIGGLVNIFLLAIFLTIVSGILAISVNYIKAFRMKNFVISTIEQYEGSSCFTNSASACSNEILKKAQSIGYSKTNLLCDTNYYPDYNKLFCYKRVCHSKGKCSYSIVTQVDFRIPVVNNLLNFDFFQVHGDTRIIEVSNIVGVFK